MTRDARQDWASWKKIHSARMGRDASKIPPISLFLGAKYYADSCHSLSDFIGKLKAEHTRIIDLESFHVMNKAAMLHLCSWLEIDFDDVLMISTFNGQRWYGNAANLQKASSFNPTIKRDAWREELSDLEIDAINRLLPGTISYLHYEIDRRKYDKGAFDELPTEVKYDSALLLIIHCFLHLAGNPLVVFPGLDSNYSIRKRVVRRIRNIMKMGKTVPYSVNLSGQLKGDKLSSLLNRLALNEERLLHSRLPPELFIDYYL